MLKNRVQYILLLFLAAILYVFLDGYFMLLVLLALALLPLCSFLLLLLTRRMVSLTAEAPLSIDSAPEIVYTLENKSPLPAAAVEWEMTLEDNLNGGKTGQSLRGFIRGKGKEEARLSLMNARTGKLTAATKKARVTDFLGLFAFPLALPAPLNIYIYPEFLDIAQAGPNRLESDGDCVNYSQSRPGPDVNETFALHEYMEGDDLRKVHWKLSSKTDVLMVRDFGLPLNSQITLLLELMPPNHSADGEELSLCLDIFASLSAALAQRGTVHNIAWYDREYEAFHMEQITELAELQIALPALLEAKSYDAEPHALHCYMQKAADSGSGVMLYYITARPDSALISEAANIQPVRTIIVGDGETAGSGIPEEADTVRVGPNMRPELAI
ncbi:MAG: DUF58 domain-containing protein [Clostridiales bacterium]|nr:DUF58 domain-containing protein [Clostridiales bacterium]